MIIDIPELPVMASLINAMIFFVFIILASYVFADICYTCGLMPGYAKIALLVATGVLYLGSIGPTWCKALFMFGVYIFTSGMIERFWMTSSNRVKKEDQPCGIELLILELVNAAEKNLYLAFQ